MKSQESHIRKTGKNSGATMTEVMVGFFMLIIVMGGMLRVFQITGASIIHADDILIQYRDLTGACYLDSDAGGADEVEKIQEHAVLKFQNEEDGAVFEAAAERQTFQIPEGRALYRVIPPEREEAK